MFKHKKEETQALPLFNYPIKLCILISAEQAQLILQVTQK